MFDEQSYRAAITTMRAAAAIPAGGSLKTKKTPAIYQYTLSNSTTGSVMVLHISLPDFYLKGIQVGNAIYLFYKSSYTVMGLAVSSMKFDETYLRMGWDKQNEETTVTVDELNYSLKRVATAKSSGADWKNIVIGFCEAFRFDNIRDKVCSGTSITGEELRWTDTATVRKG